MDIDYLIENMIKMFFAVSLLFCSIVMSIGILYLVMSIVMQIK